MPSNQVYCDVGREWLKSVYDLNGPSFIIKTRNHHTNKSNPDKMCEDITFNKKMSDNILDNLEKITTINKFLLIVRTYKKNEKFIPRNCYFIIASENYIQKVIKRQGYFSIKEKDYPHPGTEHISNDRSLDFYLIENSYLVKLI